MYKPIQNKTTYYFNYKHSEAEKEYYDHLKNERHKTFMRRLNQKLLDNA